MPSRANDGEYESDGKQLGFPYIYHSNTFSDYGELKPWWRVELRGDTVNPTIEFWSRADCLNDDCLENAAILNAEEKGSLYRWSIGEEDSWELSSTCKDLTMRFGQKDTFTCTGKGKFVFVTNIRPDEDVTSMRRLTLTEVRVTGTIIKPADNKTESTFLSQAVCPYKNTGKLQHPRLLTCSDVVLLSRGNYRRRLTIDMRMHVSLLFIFLFPFNADLHIFCL